MSPREDDTIREKIGSMQSDVKHMSYQVEKIAVKLDEANDNIVQLRTSTVKQSECTDRTQVIFEKLDQLKEEVSKKITRPENRIVKSGKAVSGIFYVDDGSTEKKKRKPLFSKIKDNVTVAIAIFTLVGIVIAGIVKFAHVIVTIEETLEARSEKERREFKKVDELHSEIRKMRSEYKKVIYVPVYPDMGPEPKARNRRIRRSRHNQ